MKSDVWRKQRSLDKHALPFHSPLISRLCRRGKASNRACSKDRRCRSVAFYTTRKMSLMLLQDFLFPNVLTTAPWTGLASIAKWCGFFFSQVFNMLKLTALSNDSPVFMGVERQPLHRSAKTMLPGCPGAVLETSFFLTSVNVAVCWENLHWDCTSTLL